MCGGLDPLNLFNDGNKSGGIKRHTRFSSRSSIDTLKNTLLQLFEKNKIVVKQAQKDSGHSKLRASLKSPQGEVEFAVRLNVVTEGVNMVEFARARGNGLEFYKLYSNIVEELGQAGLVENFKSDAGKASHR